MSLTPRLSILLPNRVRIRLVLLAVFGVILLGTVTFHLVEGWSILDGLPTVTTVGFAETRIEGGDMLIVIGNAESLTRLGALARGRVVEVKS